MILNEGDKSEKRLKGSKELKMTTAQWWIQSGKKETESEVHEKDFKLRGQVRNPMLAEQEDEVNEVPRGKTTDMKIKATYIQILSARHKMDWLRMVFSTSMG